jgi:hypothetical protein
MIKDIFKIVSKTAQISFRLVNKAIPSVILELAVLEGLVVLAARTNTSYDNTIVRNYIEQSALPSSYKVKLLSKL